MPPPDGGVRKTYDELPIFELGKSISEVGMIYPLMVQEIGPNRYELIIGSRRLRAAKNLKLARIPAVIIEGIDDRSKLELMLTENLHRQDLTPFEEAWAILRLINEHKMTLQAVAKRIGRSESTVRNRIQLLSLDKEVQELVSQRKLSVTQIDTLARLASPEDQVQFARAAAINALSPNELTRLVREELAQKKARKGIEENGKQKHKLVVHSATRIRLKITLFTEWLKEMSPSLSRLLKNERLIVEHTLWQLDEQIRKMLPRDPQEKRKRR